MCGQKPDAPLRVDLGCGKRKHEGHVGIDRVALAGVDILTDFETELPIEDHCVDQIFSNFFFEHVKNIIKLFQEVYRISKPGAIITFTVPFFQSYTQYKDPTHCSFIPPEMLRYFSDEKWYGSDYQFGVNFKVLNTKYNYLPPFDRMMSPKLILLRPFIYPFILFGRRFLWNVVHSVTFTLRAEK